MISKIWFVKNIGGGTFYFDTREEAERQAKSVGSYDKVYQTCLHCSRLFDKDSVKIDVDSLIDMVT